MRRPAIFAAALFLLLQAASEVRAARAAGISPAEFIEQVSSMLESEPPPPAVSEAEVIELEERDPRTYVFINRAKAHPPVPVNLGGDGRLSLTRQDSGEQVTAAYRRADGTYDQGELDRISRLMRCSLTAKAIPVSIKLLEILDAIEDKFGKSGLTLLSGYRTPTLNRQLTGAARWSMHMLGWAADIRIPGRSPASVAAYARKGHAGGVGHYPDAAFTHLDSGYPRYWVVRRAPANRAAVKPQAAPAK